MTIRRKLLFVAGLNLLLLIGLGVAALAQSAVINTNASSLGRDVVPALESATVITRLIEQYRSLQGAHLAATDQTQREQVEQEMRTIEGAMETEFTTMTPLAADDEEENTLFERLKVLWSQFTSQTAAAFLPTSRGADTNRAAAVAAYQQLGPIYKQVSDTTQELAAFNIDEGETNTKMAQDTYRTSQLLVLAITLGAIIVSLAFALRIAHQLTSNLSQLSQATAAVAAGDLDQPIRVGGRDEVGQLAGAFRTMLDALRASRATLSAQQLALETRGAELEQTVQALQTAIDTSDQMRDSLRNLSCPVVPVLDGVLVMPLIGQIDDQRADLLINTLLDAVQDQRAHTVFIDITGVPVVDTQVAQTLMQVANTVQLLGARALLVGLRPEVAQTIVGLGLNLTTLRTFADLRSGINSVLGQGRQARVESHAPAV
jgi:anti-anti-sigma regulatory factor/HAMP domain-containing protein